MGAERYIYQNELRASKACFHHHMAHILRHRTSNIVKDQRIDGYQGRLSSVVYISFD